MGGVSGPAGLRISIEEGQKHRPTIVLSGYVDPSTSPALREALGDMMDKGHRDIEIDLRDVTFMDSSGIGALATAYKRGAHVTVHNPSPTVMRELVMCGLDQFVSID